MTITARNAQGESIRTSQLWAWILAVVFLPAATAIGTMYVQGAVYGEKIATIERQQAKIERHDESVDERLRAIEMQLGRVLQKLEAIK
jgi:hypothetical protein